MFKSKYLFALIVCLASVPLSLPALEVKEGVFKNADVFGIRFGKDEREFFGRTSKVVSLSLQEYVTASFLVTELTVDMEGSPLQLRVYHTEPFDPNKPLERLREGMGEHLPSAPGVPAALGVAADRAKEMSAVPNKAMNLLVVKEYPLTTHSKTLEYRVTKREELVNLYRALRNRWIAAESIGDDFKADQSREKDPEQPDPLKKSRLNGVLFIVN